jgi:hypothetical protein
VCPGTGQEESKEEEEKSEKQKEKTKVMAPGNACPIHCLTAAVIRVHPPYTAV